METFAWGMPAQPLNCSTNRCPSKNEVIGAVFLFYTEMTLI